MDDNEKRLDTEQGAPAEEELTERSERRRERSRELAKDKRLKVKNSRKLEKLLKKQKKKEARSDSDREVLTYEDMPLEERQQERVKSKKKIKVRKFVAVSLIGFILFSVVFVAFDDNKLSWHNVRNFVKYGLLNQRSDETFPLDIKGENITAGNFIRLGQDICYCSDTKTQMLNNYGRSEFTVQHAFINPVLTVGKKGVLVYNLGGTGYQVISKDGKTVYNGTAKDNILVCDYGDNGSYAVVTESGGYLSKLYVYNEKNEQIYSYSFADYYVTSVSVSPKGKQVVVSGVSALDGVEIASIYVLDFTKETPRYFEEVEDNIIYSVEYLNNKYACAVGRSASYVINTSNGEIKTNSYDGRGLTAFDINKNTATYTLSLSNSNDGRNCDIVSYKKNGEQYKSFSVEEKIIDLATYKNRVALLTDDDVRLYSKDGKSYSQKALNSDPHAVVMYTTSDVYVLCTGFIDVFRL